MPKKFAVIDCETDPFKEGRVPEPFTWGYYDPENGFLQYDSIDELFRDLQGQNLRIYAHNGGKFDFHYMLHLIPSWSKVIMINGRLAQFRIDDLEFVDSYCILPVPLASYNKTEIDYTLFEKEVRDLPDIKQKINDYLRDDCKFTYDLIEAFIAENGHSLTIASCAIKKLQKIEGLKIEDSGREFFENIRPYYYGGRVECFHKGLIEGPIEYFDINSAYPYAMLHEHPFGSYIKTRDSKPDIKGHNFYTVKCKSIGAFPYRKEDKSLFFPNDNEVREFHVTGWELIAAQETKNLKVTHIKQLVFLETKNFSKYVNYYYNIKQSSKKGTPENIFAKLFLNSAYGKFAADPSKYKETYLCPIEDFQNAITQGFDIHGELHDRLIISKQNDESQWRHYNVATGASITGFVRAYLYRALQQTETPLYCDTDSIIFKGAHTLQAGSELGNWKSEGVFDVGGIAGKKIYCLKNTHETKTACKGLILNYDEILSICKGDTISKTPINPIFSIKKGKYFLKKTISMT